MGGTREKFARARGNGENGIFLEVLDAATNGEGGGKAGGGKA